MRLRDLARLLFVLLMIAGTSSTVGAQSKVGNASTLDSLLSLLEITTEPEARLQLFYDLTSDYNNVNPVESMRFADSAIHWAKKLGNEKRWYQGQYAKGAGFYFLGQNDSAEKYVRLAVNKAEEMNVLVDVVDASNLLGAVLKAQGAYPEALAAFQKGLATSKEIKDTSQIYTLMVNMAEIYSLQQELDESQRLYQEGLELILATDGRESFAAAVVWNNLAELEVISLDSAFVFLNRAQKIFSDFGYPDGRAHTHANLGERYLEIQAYEKAEEAYRQAIAIWSDESVNFKPGLVVSYAGLAETLAATGREKGSRAYFDLAIQLGEEFDLKPELKTAYLKRAEMEEKDGDPAAALAFLKKGTKLNETLLNEAKTKELSQSRVRFETEEKEKELAKAELDLARQRNRINGLLLIGLTGLLLLGGAFWYLRNRQLIKRKEAELALQLKASEAETLRELNQLKSRFFANISHEFRTPLTLILGPLKQLIQGKETATPETHYRLMQRNAERLLHLINQLLDLSKLEAGKMKLRLKQGDLVHFVKSIAGQFESWAVSKEIRFHTHFPQGKRETAFDPDKLGQAISNLLSNAMKYTPEGGDVWLNLRFEEGAAILTIRDNGIGMSEEELEKIFDRFYQASAENFNGTGIGLALVKELSELWQGEISVSSEFGKGSVFELRIPTSDSNSELESIEGEPEMPWLLVPDRGQAMSHLPFSDSASPKVLIAEDNAEVRQYVRSILEAEYEVWEAENGQQALEISREKLPDLVISDIMMPEMDGYELTRQLKQDLRTGHIPVIQLTAKSGRESRLEGLKSLADDYILKPFDQEELLVLVHNRIEQRKRLSRQLGKEIVRLSPQEIAVQSADQVFLERVIAIAEDFMQEEAFGIEDWAKEVGLSRSQLHRKLKALSDLSPSIFLRNLRLKRARQLIEQEAATIAEISFQVGFSSPAYFSKCFKDFYGTSPSEVKA